MQAVPLNSAWDDSFEGRFYRTKSEAILDQKNREKWNKAKAKPWGTTDQDLLKSFRMAKHDDLEHFRTVRRAHLQQLEQEEEEKKNLSGSNFSGSRRGSRTSLSSSTAVQALQLSLHMGSPTHATASSASPPVSKPGTAASQLIPLTEAAEEEDEVYGADGQLFGPDGSQRTSQEDDEELSARDRALLLLASGDFEGALEEFSYVIDECDDKCDKNFEHRADARMGLHDYAGASEDLTAALEIEDRKPAVWLKRALCKWELQDYAGCIKDCTKGIIWEQDNPDLASTRARAKLALGDHEGALKDYNLAIRFDSKRPEAWFERAEARGRMGDHDGSLKDINKALDLDPKFVASWLAHARIHLRRREWPVVHRDCDTVIRLDPSNSEAWLMRGESKLQNRQYEAAIVDLDEARRLDPRSPMPFYYHGMAKFSKGLFLDAAEDARRALQNHPGHAPSKTLLRKAQEQDLILQSHKVPDVGRSTPRRKGQEHFLPMLTSGSRSVSRHSSEGALQVRFSPSAT